MPHLTRWALPALLVAAALTGCGNGRFHERYHFPGIKDGRVVNYYRVDVEGYAHGSQLRYVSGFFDEDALNRYFNTFSQPDKGELFSYTSAEPAESSHSKADGEEVQADPAGLDRKLVLLMSQNSQAVADQIGALADSEAFATIVGRTIFREELAQLESDRLRAIRSDAVNDSLQAEASTLAERLRADAATLSNDDAEALLLNFVNQVAAAAGSTQVFTEFDDARQWLDARRARANGGG